MKVVLCVSRGIVFAVRIHIVILTMIRLTCVDVGQHPECVELVVGSVVCNFSLNCVSFTCSFSCYTALSDLATLLNDLHLKFVVLFFHEED